MQPWWWRSVAACSAALVVAGVVAAVAAGADADRAVAEARVTSAGVASDRGALAGAPVPPAAAPPAAAPPAAAPPDPAGQAVAPPPARTGPLADRPRVTDVGTGASVAVPDGWAPVPTQDLVPVAPDRFGATLILDDRGVVMVGPLDPERVTPPAPTPPLPADAPLADAPPAAAPPPTPEALGDEARRLVAAFADGTAPDAVALVPLDDDVEDTIAGRPASTVLLRAEGGPERTDGALIRVSTVAPAPGAPRGVVALAVVLPGPDQDPEARSADDVVRSLEPVSSPGP